MILKLHSVISISIASVERSFSCLKRLKTYLHNKMGQECLSCLCSISVHKDVIKQVEDKNTLHDRIVQKSVEKPRRLNFLFKYMHEIVMVAWMDFLQLICKYYNSHIYSRLLLY